MRKLRGRPFQVGNKYGKGRPRGSRNKLTREGEMLLHKYKLPITTKVIHMALQGDRTALKLCWELLYGQPRSEPVKLAGLEDAASLTEALNIVIRAVGNGQIAAEDAEKIVHVLERKRSFIETVELQERLEALRQAQSNLKESRATDESPGGRDEEPRKSLKPAA